jgi:hypothetical protein
MGKLSLWSFLSEQGRDLPLPGESVAGKTIVVTGANVGLGLEASVHIANKEPSLLIATCRDTVKCEQTVNSRCDVLSSTLADSHTCALSSPRTLCRISTSQSRFMAARPIFFRQCPLFCRQVRRRRARTPECPRRQRRHVQPSLHSNPR